MKETKRNNDEILLAFGFSLKSEENMIYEDFSQTNIP